MNTPSRDSTSLKNAICYEELLAEEREIYRKQALQEGKPEKVIDRIVDEVPIDGISRVLDARANGFSSERCGNHLRRQLKAQEMYRGGLLLGLALEVLVGDREDRVEAVDAHPHPPLDADELVRGELGLEDRERREPFLDGVEVLGVQPLPLSSPAPLAAVEIAYDTGPPQAPVRSSR